MSDGRLAGNAGRIAGGSVPGAVTLDVDAARRRLEEFDTEGMRPEGFETIGRLALFDLPAALAALEEVTRERDELREREAFWAKVLHVPDGGRYRNDWTSRLENLMARAEKAEAEREQLREALVAIWTISEDGYLDYHSLADQHYAMADRARAVLASLESGKETT